MLSYFIAASLIMFTIRCTFTESQQIQIIPDGTIYASEGETLNVTCYYFGDEYHDLKWFNEDGIHFTFRENNSRVYVVKNHWWRHHSAILVFDTVMVEDSSIYSCWGRWGNSSENSTVEIIVNKTVGYPPKFDTEFVSLEFFEGNDALLECSADGQPTPEYTWLDTHGRNMHNGTGSWDVSSEEGWLLLYSVNKSQEGIYTCVARNIHGSAGKMYMVSVSRGRAPWFHQETEYYEFLVGSNISLGCHAEGEPAPYYTWYDDNGRNMHNRPQNWNASSDGRLEIYSIQVAQQGNYTCIASNLHGNATKLFEVKVRFSETAVIVKELWQTHVVFGLEEKLKLSKQGYAYVVTKFLEQSNTSSFSRTRILWLIGEKYIVTGLKPGRTYEFEFYATKTARGTELHLSNVILTLPPFSPLIIVTEIKDTTMRIEFPYQSMDEIDGYLKPEYYVLRYVQLQQKSGAFYERGCPIEIQIPYCFGRWYEIGGLSPKNYYKVQLSTMLKDGASKKSEIIVYV